MARTHNELVQILAALYPASEWSYSGDGSTLDGLTWNDPDIPAPTLKVIEKAFVGVQLKAVIAAKSDEITAVLAATDHWGARATEESNGVMPADKAAYRKTLRSLLAQAQAGNDVATVQSIAIPPIPS